MDNKRNNSKKTELTIEAGKIPPQAIDVETLVLAGLMIDREAWNIISPILQPEHFYKNEHQKIFAAIKTLNEAGKPVDLVTVTAKMRADGTLEEAGGAYAITMISSMAASASNIEYHARIIQQVFMQRELIRIGHQTATNGFDDTMDIDDQIGELKTNLDELENLSTSGSTGKHTKDCLYDTLKEIQEDSKNVEAGRTVGITTGLTLLNTMTGGWRDTNLVILAARPGVGKTSLALHFAKAAAREKKWVNFIGLEMTSEDLMRIVIASECEVNRTKIRDGELTSMDWVEIESATNRIIELPIMWYDNANITANHIASTARRNKKKGKCDLMIIDYLQLINSPSNKNQNREQQIAEITRTLKRTALECKIPIILLSQLNREAAEGIPQLHHLRESGAIEQDADIVLMPYRDTDDNYMIRIAKNRRGKVGTIEIGANDQMTRFSNTRPDSPPFPTHAPQNNFTHTQVPF